MRIDVQIDSNGVLAKMLAALGPEGRRDLHAVAAQALKNAVQNHVRRYARSKHASARAFNAQPTGHYEKGAAAVSFEASPERGLVHIPIPGISRAYRDVEIAPSRAGRLTVPVPSGGSAAYGRTVAELRALGWNFFKARGNLLFGTRGEGDDRETRLMFILKESVRQVRDPSLLPPMDENARTCASAMLGEIRRVVAKARGGAA